MKLSETNSSFFLLTFWLKFCCLSPVVIVFFFINLSFRGGWFAEILNVSCVPAPGPSVVEHDTGLSLKTTF